MKAVLAVLLCMGAAVCAHAQTTDDLFNDRVLHEVRLHIHPADWSSLQQNFRDNTYYAADMEWFFNGRPVAISQIGVRTRGVGSRNPIKPGLLLDFNRYNDDLRFLNLRSLVLRSNVQDPSMLREFLAMALMRRVGMSAPRESFARLYINGEYFGLYTLVENVDRNFLQRNFGEDDGHLYSYQYNFNFGDYRFEYLGSDPQLYLPTLFAPETHEENPDAAYLEELIRTINQAPSASFASAVSNYLHLPRAIQQAAVESYLAERDGLLGDWGTNNFFIYRFQNSQVSHLIPWDKSIAFSDITRSVWQNTDQSVLIRRSLEIPGLRSIYVNELINASDAAGGPGGWLEQEIDRVYGLVRAAAHEDSKKLCDSEISGTFRPCSNGDFDAAVEFLRHFARERNDAVRRELSF